MPLTGVVKYTFPDGESIDLYYVSYLASALGRTPATIRKWEVSGVLPDPFFKDRRGNRLYSQEQIDAVVKCAERAKIKQGMSIANTSFKVWVHKELSIISKKYAEKSKKSGGVK
jgi:hypothetical protein